MDVEQTSNEISEALFEEEKWHKRTCKIVSNGAAQEDAQEIVYIRQKNHGMLRVNFVSWFSTGESW